MSKGMLVANHTVTLVLEVCLRIGPAKMLGRGIGNVLCSIGFTLVFN
jgi:hypothetical protein